MDYLSVSLKNTSKIAHNFLKNLRQKKNAATLVCLQGDLGSGKTAFTKELAILLGIPKKEVTSPTFVIMKIFEIQHSLFERFIHIDAYRINSPKEMLNLGWKEIIRNPKNLIIIEWPERLKKILPNNPQWINFKFVNKSTRKIKIV